MARVLVVDDEKSIRITLKAFLAEDGYEVSTAEHVDEALALLSATPHDIVISDIVLPRLSGVELLRQIRDSWPDTLVIMITGEPTVETASEALRLGAFDYLMKPVRKASVLHVVSRAASSRALADRNRDLEAENRRYQSGLEYLVAQRTTELQLLYDAAREMGSTLDPDRTVHALFRTLRRAMPYTCAAVFVCDDATGAMRVAAATDGPDTPAAFGSPFHTDLPHLSIVGDALRTGEAILRNATIEHPGVCPCPAASGALAGSAPGACSMLAIPMRADGRVTGIVRVAHEGAHVYTPEHLRVAEALASHLSAALTNADLYGRTVAEVERRRQAEDGLRALNQALDARVAERTQQLQEANEELDSFAYSVSHDLRAPLRSITGFSQILLEDPEVEGETRRMLGLVLRGALDMDRMVQGLLQFSRLSQRHLEVGPVDVRTIVVEVIEDELRSAQGRSIETRIGELPMCACDAFLLRIVLANLLSNAVKYTRSRDHAIIEVFSERRDGETVYGVRDNGCGFDMRYSDRLFKVFTRLHSDAEYEGVGAGLALVHRIVRRHGGRVWLAAVPGEGATARFALAPRGAAPEASEIGGDRDREGAVV